MLHYFLGENMGKIKGILRKIYDCPPSTCLIGLNLYDYEPPKGIKDFVTCLIACIPILCVLQSILLIKKIKAPYGSYWIYSAMSRNVNENINKMFETVFKVNIKHFNFINYFTLITLIILVLLYFTVRKQIREDKNKSAFVSIFGVVAILGIIAFLVIDFPDFINLIKNPDFPLSFSYNISSALIFRFILMVIEIAFVLIISLNLFSIPRKVINLLSFGAFRCS